MGLAKEIKNNIGIVKIIGETNVNTEKKMIELMKELCAKTKNCIILDLENCTYIDSGAIGAIILIDKYISDLNGKFCITGINSENIDNLFMTTRLYNLIKKFDTADSAIESYFN